MCPGHRASPWRLAIVLAAVATLLCSAPAPAQEVGQAQGPVAPGDLPRPSLRAFRAQGPITLDGVLDEPSWSLADSTTGTFWLTQPQAGYPAPDRTVIRIMYDDEALYMGAVLYDPEPHRAISAGLEQDFSPQASDIFGMAIDASFDRQSAYVFGANPAGAKWDAQSFNDGAAINSEWEGIYEVETSTFADGWIMEMRIPLTTLRFPGGEGEQTWGLNFSRQVRRRNEYATWAAIPRQFRVFRMSEAGTLEGLPAFKPGRNLQVKPFFTGSNRDGELHPEGPVRDFDAGLDAKWAVTPRLVLDLTAFTDFSQVEVDEEQINLTRFSLFFPEKRDFFLENDGIFTFADDATRTFRSGASPRNFKLFHSRRIGLSDAREPLPIAGGGRLSGRIGRYELGLLDMQTLREGDSPAENFAVARVRRSVLTRSDVGFILVNRQATSATPGESYSRAGGVDANLRFDRLQLNAYAALTDDAGPDGDRSIGSVQVGWRDPVFDFSILTKHVGAQFRPEVGFVSRTAVNQWFASGGVHLQRPVSWLTEVNPYVDVTEYYSTAWDFESREVKPGLTVIANDGGRFTAEFSHREERLREASPILGVPVAAGDYAFDLVSLSYSSSGARVVAGDVSFSFGEFFDGDRSSVTGTLTLRPNEHLLLEGSAQRNRIELSGTPIDADLFRGRMQFGYNTRTFLSAFVQYNRVERELLTNVRFNLIHA
ncbi:MAG: DUF5916 domain-containing protein, partial [Longimicrobiales bacterium]|nr:DUF5916 domain-containing protein [Longimicrobiales bacterium]